MSRYVLVHGMFEGAWAWYKVAPLLAREGHTVTAFDLPAHSVDLTSPTSITLQSYVDAVVRELDGQPEPVVLVGHSMGGIAISGAAEVRPEKVRALVYVAAVLLRSGESMAEVTGTDTNSLFGANLLVNKTRDLVALRRDKLSEVLYHDCSEEDQTLAQALFRPDPMAPLSAPLHTTEARFGRLPRIYIRTALDRAITPELQERMCAAVPCARVLTLQMGHSPALAAPTELATHLMSA